VEKKHIYIERGGAGIVPQVNFSISLISYDVHSMVKRDVQLNVKHNDSPSHVMQSDAPSRQLTQTSPSYQFHLTLVLALLDICFCFVIEFAKTVGAPIFLIFNSVQFIYIASNHNKCHLEELQ